MWGIKVIALLLCLIVLCLAKKDDNRVEINVISGEPITDFKSVEPAEILADSDCNGFIDTPKHDNNKWSTNLYCDRIGSEMRAAAFVGRSGMSCGEAKDTNNCPTNGPFPVWAVSSSAIVPGKLNLFFAVNITAGGKHVKVYLGQGHRDTTVNDWWIGGPSVVSNGNQHRLYIPNTNIAYRLERGGVHDGSVNKFDLYQIDPLA